MEQTLRLAVIQFTPVFGNKEENFKRLKKLVEAVEADIIIFPELCTTGYFFQSKEEAAQYAEPLEGETGIFFRTIAEEHQAIVVAGFVEKDGEQIYNTALIIIPEQEQTYFYRKTHLFYKERYCFDEGNTGFFVVYDEKRDLRLGTMICYDWRFPEAARTLALQGADLIACPSNLVTDAWRIVMPGRAIENKLYIAVPNRAGVEQANGEEVAFKGNSTIYGYNGAELCAAGPEEDTVLLTDIIPQQTRDKSFNPLNDVLKDRRPEHYRSLTE